MKKILLTITLIASITLIGCEKKGLAENTVYSSSIAENTIATTSLQPDLAIEEPQEEVTISSIINDFGKIKSDDPALNDLMDAMNDIKIILKTQQEFHAKGKATEDEFNEYTDAMREQIGSLIEKGLDASNIEAHEFQNFSNFLGDIIEDAVKRETLEKAKETSSQTPEIDKSEYDIDLLYSSVLSNDQDLVLKILLSDKVDINARTSGDDHVLSAALCFDNCEMVSILLSAGADMDAKNSEGISIYTNAMDSDSRKLRSIFNEFKNKKAQ